MAHSPLAVMFWQGITTGAVVVFCGAAVVELPEGAFVVVVVVWFDGAAVVAGGLGVEV